MTAALNTEKGVKVFSVGNMHKPIWAHKKIMIINNYITSKCHKESKMLSKPKWEMQEDSNHVNKNAEQAANLTSSNFLSKRGNVIW
jgi:hypothetical protein